MRPADNTENLIKKLRYKAGAETHRRIFSNIEKALDETQTKKPAKPNIWRILMKSQKTKFATAATIILAVLAITILNHSARPAWAIEQTIEALKQYNALRLRATSISDGQEHNLEIWTTANKERTQTDKLVLRVDNGVVLWVDNGKTYTYDPVSNAGVFEDARTAGFSTWFGPRMFELFSAISDKKIIYGRDPATGRQRVILTFSMADSNGPQSWQFEFDAETKLPIRFAFWSNMQHRGRPDFACWEITYFEEAPENVFDVDVPANAAFHEKEIVIPEYNLDLMSNPDCGISTEGLTESEACRKILEQMWQAVMDENLTEMRKLCPITRGMNDKFLKVALVGVDGEDRVVEVIEIGDISQRDQSRLGPLAVVPSIVRCQDGSKQQVKQIIQFRNINGQSSCVIHGPYGLPVTVE
jgi:hypothetical protein